MTGSRHWNKGPQEGNGVAKEEEEEAIVESVGGIATKVKVGLIDLPS